MLLEPNQNQNDFNKYRRKSSPRLKKSYSKDKQIDFNLNPKKGQPISDPNLYHKKTSKQQQSQSSVEDSHIEANTKEKRDIDSSKVQVEYIDTINVNMKVNVEMNVGVGLNVGHLKPMNVNVNLNENLAENKDNINKTNPKGRLNCDDRRTINEDDINLNKDTLKEKDKRDSLDIIPAIQFSPSNIKHGQISDKKFGDGSDPYSNKDKERLDYTKSYNKNYEKTQKSDPYYSTNDNRKDYYQTDDHKDKYFKESRYQHSSDQIRDYHYGKYNTMGDMDRKREYDYGLRMREKYQTYPTKDHYRDKDKTLKHSHKFGSHHVDDSPEHLGKSYLPYYNKNYTSRSRHFSPTR